MTMHVVAQRLVAATPGVGGAEVACTIANTGRLIVAYGTESTTFPGSGYAGHVRVAAHMADLTPVDDVEVGQLDYMWQGGLVAGTVNGEPLIVAEGMAGGTETARAWTLDGHAWDAATAGTLGRNFSDYLPAPVDNGGAMWLATNDNLIRLTDTAAGTPLALPAATYAVQMHGAGVRILTADHAAYDSAGATWTPAGSVADPWPADPGRIIYAATSSIPSAGHFAASHWSTGGAVHGPYVVNAATGAAELLPPTFELSNSYITSASTPTADGGTVFMRSGLIGGVRALVATHIGQDGQATQALLPGGPPSHGAVWVASRGDTVLVVAGGGGEVHAWALSLSAPAPDPVIPPPFSIPEVLIDGVPADIESIRVRADSPADFRIPPGGSTLALSQATLGWEHRDDVQVDAEQPWHGTWRPTPGASVEVRLPKPHGADGFIAFTGILDTTDGALAPSTLTSRAISPLADVDATFTAPALNRVMPCPPGGGTPESRRFVHSGTSWYVVEAFEAIGARYTVPVGGFTVWRQTMAGSTWPTVGDLLVSQELNDAGAGPDTPTPEDQSSTYAPQFGPAYGEPGRVTMSDGWCHGATAPYGGAAGDAWTIAHDVDEDPAADYRVRLHSAVSQAGLEVRVAGSTITVRTVDGAGAVDATLGSIPRAGVSRVMVRYDSGTVTAAADSDPGTVHTWTATIAALTAAQAHVTIYGHHVGAVTIDRAGDPLAGHDHLVWPRQGLIHISPIPDERWRFHSHPAIVSEAATTWLARRAHAEQALLHVDQTNRVHWVEVRGFDDLPVVGELTDATLYGTTPTP